MNTTKRIPKSFIEVIQIQRQVPVMAFDIDGCAWVKKLVTRGDCELIKAFGVIRVIMANDPWFTSLDRATIKDMPNGDEPLTHSQIQVINKHSNYKEWAV